MKRLLSYMCAYKKESILGPLFKMLEASFELFVPLVVANMVDVGIANGSVSYVVRMGGLLLLLAIIGLTCSLTAQYFAAKAATGTATALRNNLFSPYWYLILYRDRYHRNLHPDHTNDQRHQPGAEWYQHDPASAVTFPIRCIRCHGHGIYSRCPYSDGICSDHSCTLRGNIWYHVDKYAIIPVCTETAG